MLYFLFTVFLIGCQTVNLNEQRNRDDETASTDSETATGYGMDQNSDPSAISDTDTDTDSDADTDMNSDVDTDTDTDSHRDTDTDANSDTDADTDTDTGADTDTDTDADTDTDTDAENDTDTDAENDTDTDVDTDTDTDVDTDTDSDADTDSDTDTDGDIDSDTDTDTDGDTDTDIDTDTDTDTNINTDMDTETNSGQDSESVSVFDSESAQLNDTDTLSHFDIESGLMGYWPLDETDGQLAHDLSGNGNDGTVIGDPDWLATGGRQSGALRFDGTNGTIDYVEIPNSPTLENIQEGSYTLSAWVRPHTTPAGAAPSDNNYAYGILVKPGHHLGMWYDTNRLFGSAHFFENEPLDMQSNPHDPGSYYHVALTFDLENGVYTVYINGESDVSVDFTAGRSDTLEFNQNRWYIGIANPGATTYAWPSAADIDDVRIYDRALTQNDVRALVSLGVF